MFLPCGCFILMQKENNKHLFTEHFIYMAIHSVK